MDEPETLESIVAEVEEPTQPTPAPTRPPRSMKAKVIRDCGCG